MYIQRLNRPGLVADFATGYLKQRKQQIESLNLGQTIFIFNEDFNKFTITFANCKNSEFIEIYCDFNSTDTAQDLCNSLYDLFRTIEDRQLAEKAVNSEIDSKLKEIRSLVEGQDS